MKEGKGEDDTAARQPPDNRRNTPQIRRRPDPAKKIAAGLNLAGTKKRRSGREEMEEK